MKPMHMLLATLVAVIWGCTFVATRIALDAFSPPQLTALRFLVAAVPALVLPRPRVPWRMLLATGLTLFAFQFLLQFFAIANGMPPGLAAVTIQTQAFFTVLLAALVLGERPSPRQLAGMGAALLGLVLIGLTVGRGLSALGLSLIIAAAVSWSVGNVLLKRLPAVNMLHLIAWLSLVPPLPSLALSFVQDGPASLPLALGRASWPALFSVLCLGLLSTSIAFAIWGHLLRLYPAAAVAPFALLVPVVGALASALAFGEQFEPLRLAGIAAMLLGLAIIAFPLERLALFRARR